jgi:hypothetical protein
LEILWLLLDVTQLLIIAHDFRNAVRCGQVIGMSRESDTPKIAGHGGGDVSLGHLEKLGLLFEEERAPARGERGDAACCGAGERIEHLSARRRVEPEQLREQIGRLARGMPEGIAQRRHKEYV